MTAGLTQPQAAYLARLVRDDLAAGGDPGRGWPLLKQLSRLAGLVPACPHCGAEPAGGLLACGSEGDGCPLLDPQEPAHVHDVAIISRPLGGCPPELTPLQRQVQDELASLHGRVRVLHLPGGLVQLLALDTDDQVQDVKVLNDRGHNVLRTSENHRTELLKQQARWMQEYDRAPDGSPRKQKARERLDSLSRELRHAEARLDELLEGL